MDNRVTKYSSTSHKFSLSFKFTSNDSKTNEEEDNVWRESCHDHTDTEYYCSNNDN